PARAQRAHGANAPLMRLGELLADVASRAPEVLGPRGKDEGVVADPAVTAVVQSHLDAVPGALFVARRGERHDAHELAHEAIGRGAVAVIGERKALSLPVPYVAVPDARKALPHLAAAFHGHPSERLRVIG